MRKNIFFFPTDIGKIGIAESDNTITNVYFQCATVPENTVINPTDILKEAGRQLQSYFTGKLKVFSLPLAPVGTEFMMRVWNSLQTIPYGETRSYKEIAQSIGNPKAYRAVGLANNKNPIPIFIPCHRVIGADGKMVGFRSGIEIKAYLLNLEKQYRSLS